MYKNKSPFSHNQAPGAQPRSPLSGNQLPSNYLFSQVLNTNGTMNKIKPTLNNPSANNNLNSGGSVLKKISHLNFDDDLGCDQVLIKPKAQPIAKDNDFICNEQLTPMGRQPSKQTQFQVQSPTELLMRRPNPQHSHCPSVPSLMDLKCNEELAQKQNSRGSGEFSEVLRRTTGLLETYKNKIVEMFDEINRLKAENERLHVKNYGR